MWFPTSISGNLLSYFYFWESRSGWQVCHSPCSPTHSVSRGRLQGNGTCRFVVYYFVGLKLQLRWMFTWTSINLVFKMYPWSSNCITDKRFFWNLNATIPWYPRCNPHLIKTPSVASIYVPSKTEAIENRSENRHPLPSMRKSNAAAWPSAISMTWI